MKGRTAIELQRRCNTLIQLVEREYEEKEMMRKQQTALTTVGKQKAAQKRKADAST